MQPAIRPCSPDEGLIKGLSSPKLLELRQLVRHLAVDQGRKVVVFSQWRRMLNLSHWAVGDLLARHDLRAGFFTGAEGQKRRTQNIVEFIIQTPVMTAATTTDMNHGEYVSSMGGGKVAAQACKGMPLKSTQGTK